MQSPFGRPLFDRLGLGSSTPAPSRALPLPEGFDPNVNQPSIGDFDGRFAQAAAQSANRNPFAGMQGAGLAAVINAQIAAANNTAPTPSYLIPQRLLRDPSPRPEGSEPPQMQMTQRPPFLTNSVVLPESGFGTVGPGSAPANVQPVNQGPMFRQPGDMGRYVAFNDPGQAGAGFSNYQEYLAAGNSPAPGPTISALNPNRPFGLPQGISNMAFPTLAPSSPNTFTGPFGGNNPMNNSPMNGGGMNSNQPLSQQIPQAVQQAVTPLLQSTASQLNQGIGSMVNERLVGGGGGQTGSGGGGLPAFGGTPAPSNMSSLLLGGGFNPFR